MPQFKSLDEYNAALSAITKKELPVKAMTEILQRSKIHNPRSIDGVFAIKQLVIAIDFAEMHNAEIDKQYQAMNTESFKQANIEGCGV